MTWRIGIVLICAFAVAGCGGASETAGTEPPQTTYAPAPIATVPRVIATARGATASPTTTDEKAAVLADLEEYWRVVFRLNRSPVENDPDIARVSTGAQRRAIDATMKAKIAERHVTRSPTPSVARRTTTLLELSPTTARLSVCFVDDSYRLHLDTGQTTNTEVITSLDRVTMVKEDGRWKVAAYDGLGGCASSQ